ncbi:hypothetical protein OV079_51350 [Nannocystis pusilla]|uniref:Uncharacterized protein n=1 Tax=Nannocystis pusilla TaxID=889268 RepID=A0A9X3F0J0_9BACT|nr:hypothetical protein [Nannocystis pusilla]MCY1013789.1 hypothetical protein [Nannocystis pusilla]
MAFVMIEERQLHGLGGTLVPLDLADPLDFDGFSIGMGAGFDLKWSAARSSSRSAPSCWSASAPSRCCSPARPASRASSTSC